LGPLIGTRTWGGAVGLPGNPGPIDGSHLQVPNAGTYTADGRWIVEGWGVDSDIDVPDDPVALLAGTDVQLEAAITEMMRELKEPHFTRPEPPPFPDRSGMGVPKEER
jgi:tricorn protease